MGNVFSNKKFGLRRLVSVFLVLAFLLASAGNSHAMPASESHGHPALGASLSDEGCSSGSSEVADCQVNTVRHDQGQPTENGVGGSCCVITCTPTITAAASTDVTILKVTPIRLVVHIEQRADSNAPDGLFRPPRPRA